MRETRRVRRLGMSLAACLLGVLFYTGCGSDSSPTAPSTNAASYLNQVLDTMQANSINRYKINWTAFRQSVNQVAPSPQTIADTYPAISTALGLLNDHHSTFQKADGSYISNPNPRGGCSVPSAPTPAVPPDIGYVRVGAFNESGSAALEFATNIQKQIATADNAGLAGWIVDLRGNGGGNMYPMVAGLGPILGDGTAGAFFDADEKVTLWGYSNGASTYGDVPSVQVQVANPYTLLKPAPRVAVPTDCLVASSGEAAVIAFRGRANTRSLGTARYGLSTGNQGFAMLGGGKLLLTVSVMGDRNLTRYGDVVAPDEVTGDATRTVERAIEWLRSF